MGAWLMGTALIWVVATENFRRVDEVLDSSNPEFQQRLAHLKPGDARLVLRFLDRSSTVSISQPGESCN